MAEVYREQVKVYNEDGQPIQHPITELDAQLHNSDKVVIVTICSKEIYEQTWRFNAL